MVNTTTRIARSLLVTAAWSLLIIINSSQYSTNVYMSESSQSNGKLVQLDGQGDHAKKENDERLAAEAAMKKEDDERVTAEAAKKEEEEKRLAAEAEKKEDNDFLNQTLRSPSDSTPLPRHNEIYHSIDDDSDERYLLFFSHSGISNQLSGLERAAYLAFATNRTLVLPPVLPHIIAVADDLKYPEFTSKAAGSGCEPYERYHEYVSYVHEHVKLAASSHVQFPSYKALFDFDDIFHETGGLKVIDMPEFARTRTNKQGLFRIQNATDFSHWCTGKDATIESKAVRKCPEKSSSNFTLLAHEFNAVCDKSETIAAIGSAFVLPLGEMGGFKKQIHEYFTLKMSLSRPLLVLLTKMYNILPRGYAGVHIRFKDRFVCSSQSCEETCAKQEVETAFQNVFRQLDEKSSMSSANESVSVASNRPPFRHVLIGFGNTATLPCFKYHAKNRYNASTIVDLIDGNEELQEMVDNIQAEKSTVYAFLDQILIGIAESLELEKVEFGGSTFQSKIRVWHQRREEVLEMMKKVDV